MDQYIELIEQIESGYIPDKWKGTLNDLKKYINGEVAAKELCESKDKDHKEIVYLTLNRILNHRDGTRYYVEAPQDDQFNTGYPYSIMAARVRPEVTSNHLDIAGPGALKKSWSTMIDDTLIEIKGNFKEIPDGAMIFQSDWAKIIEKWPHLNERIKGAMKSWQHKEFSTDEVSSHINGVMNFMKDPIKGDNYWRIGKDESQHLSDQVINSIEFIEPKKFVKYQDVMDGLFEEFDSLVIKKAELEKTHSKPGDSLSMLTSTEIKDDGVNL